MPCSCPRASLQAGYLTGGPGAGRRRVTEDRCRGTTASLARPAPAPRVMPLPVTEAEPVAKVAGTTGWLAQAAEALFADTSRTPCRFAARAAEGAICA
jgi:hypothetical protein